MTANLESRDDPWQKLAAIHAQAELVRRNAIELEQLGLTLSGRDLATVDRADLVSYVVWISLFVSQNGLVLANWGFGLVGYMDSILQREGLTPPASWPPGPMPAKDVVPKPRPSGRRRGRS